MNSIKSKPSRTKKGSQKGSTSKVLLSGNGRVQVKLLPKGVPSLLLKAPKVIAGPFWNIWDTGDKYKIRVSAPGLSKRNIKVYTNGNKLTISCAKEESSGGASKVYVLKEYDSNSWSRTIALPNKVNPSDARLRYKDGIIKLDLEKLHNGEGKSK
jgi:HSP20 family molecular chaperone IbpA